MPCWQSPLASSMKTQSHHSHSLAVPDTTNYCKLIRSGYRQLDAPGLDTWLIDWYLVYLCHGDIHIGTIGSSLSFCLKVLSDRGCCHTRLAADCPIMRYIAPHIGADPSTTMTGSTKMARPKGWTAKLEGSRGRSYWGRGCFPSHHRSLRSAASPLWSKAKLRWPTDLEHFIDYKLNYKAAPGVDFADIKFL